MSRLQEIIAEILDVPRERVLATASAADFAQWDSAAQIDIMLSIEAEYGVCFSLKELAETLSVPALIACLREKGIQA